MTHFMYCPFTGLGLYNGFRGNRWLRNRIKVFKHAVIPSLLNQTNQNFILWVSWRPEEKTNPQVKELKNYIDQTGLQCVFTFHGVCFWDDKYPDWQAWERLSTALHYSMYDIIPYVSEPVLMTIQPSDDCYYKTAVEEIQKKLSGDIQAFGYKHGYVANYPTGQIAEYNPQTNPPFFTIKFPKDIFTEPLKHMNYSGPYKSHEYVGNHLKYKTSDDRGFLVGTHGENISTIFNHPYRGEMVDSKVLEDFGIKGTLTIRINLGKRLLRKTPHWLQRKLRYWLGERFLNKIYNL